MHIRTSAHPIPAALTPTALVMAALLMATLGLGSSYTQAQALSPADAASRARAETGGRILKVKPPRGDSMDYRVRVLLPEGRVRNIIVDGNSGETRYRSKPETKHHHRPFRESPELMRGFDHAPTSR
jgi:hypothetical protein